MLLKQDLCWEIFVWHTSAQTFNTNSHFEKIHDWH